MTNFEEEVRKNGGMCFAVLKNEKISYEIQGLTSSALKIFGNWRSDEDFQTKENELKRLRKLNHLYKKAQDEIAALKSQLQQQALPVVPECVAKDVKRLSLSTLADWNVAVSYISKETLEWLSTTGNTNVFLGKSWTLCSLKINGFKVEKPQLFYLKHIDFCKTDKHYDWFTIKHSDGPLNHLRVEKGEKPSTIDCKFTQKEIDSMQTGSYEQIEVTE